MYLRLQSRARSRLGPMDAKRFASTWDTGKWVARVWLTSRQAVELFPKFGSWAVGMRCESEDGNTNLPISCSTEQIVEHLSVNVRFRAPRRQPSGGDACASRARGRDAQGLAQAVALSLRRSALNGRAC